MFIFSGIVNHRFSMIMKREWIDMQALSSFLHVELLRLGTTIFKRRYGLLLVLSLCYCCSSLLSDYLYHISGNGICRFSTDWYHEMECKLSRESPAYWPSLHRFYWFMSIWLLDHIILIALSCFLYLCWVFQLVIAGSSTFLMKYRFVLESLDVVYYYATW